eukprot:g1880.t1
MIDFGRGETAGSIYTTRIKTFMKKVLQLLARSVSKSSYDVAARYITCLEDTLFECLERWQDEKTRDQRKSRGPEDRGSQKRPRGNLPPAPKFDGDRKANPKCFKVWLGKVDSYVEIARKIIDDSEIGLRLHAALEGKAAEFLEDVPARTFGKVDGWRILLRVLQDKFDEPQVHKIGSAVKGFFKMQLGSGSCTMREAADALDKAHRDCRDTGLSMPDAVLIYWYFEHAGVSQERQANLLLRTNGEYNWKLMKQAIDVLYPNTLVGNRHYTHRPAGKGRGAHEAHTMDQQQTDEVPLPSWDASEEQLEGWLMDYDPVEMLADVEMNEGVPEDLTRELHHCFATHRENRQKLAKAVKARGFYVSGSSNAGKGKKGQKGSKGKKGKGSSKGGGKARGGMTLQELKAVTTCGDCEQVGHWRGDPECPKQRRGAHEAGRGDDHDPWDADWYDDADYQWDDGTWDEFQENQARAAHTATRPVQVKPTRAPPAPTSLSGRKLEPATSYRSSSATPADENQVKKMARKVEALRKKAKPDASPLSLGAVREELAKDNTSSSFVATEAVKTFIEDARVKSTYSRAPAAASVAEAIRHYDNDTYEEVGSAWTLLAGDKKQKAPDIEALRQPRRNFMTRRVGWTNVETIPDSDDEELLTEQQIHRHVSSLTRRAPTVQDGRCYITIDTACENTVCGSSILDLIVRRFLEDYHIVPKIETESERYCFGPGEPITSSTRVSLPIAVQGVAMVVNTSTIEQAPGRAPVPFLAGQDWLLFVKAIIDVGAGTFSMPDIGVTAPLLIDHTGHVVIAIDEFPDGKWPHGLNPKAIGYEGIVFDPYWADSSQPLDVDKIFVNEGPDPLAGREIYASDRFDRFESTKFESTKYHLKTSPNYFYEPNDDDFFSNQNLTRGPCTVKPDYWEFQFDKGMIIRHHCRPRSRLFSPTDDRSGPDPDTLSLDRVTVVKGLKDVVRDVWTPLEAQQELPFVYMGNKQALRAWQRLIMAIERLWMLLARWEGINLAIREFKHRSPALMGYMEAMMRQQQQMPATVPPATTKAAGQTAKALQSAYPLQIPHCPHEVASARRLGNAHGKFLECLDCGLLKKALPSDYTVPISKEKVPVYAYLHGYRQQPGAKATKFVLKPKEAAYYGNLADCYSLSSQQALEVSINDVVLKKKADPKAKSKTKPRQSSPKRSLATASKDEDDSWDKVMEVSDEEEDGAFEGILQEKLTNMGIELDYIPAEAHWQSGDVEAFNRAFRNVGNRLIDEFQVKGEQDMRLLGAQVAASLNDRVRMSGASANEWVFGRNPSFPADLLDFDGKAEALMGMDRDSQLRWRQSARSRADTLISEYRTNEALQKAVMRQSRPPRQRYEPGELVAFWRNIKKKKGKLVQPGWFRGTIIRPQKGSEEGKQSNYWITSNGRCVLVSLEQLRPAYGTELWPIAEDDLQWLEDNMPDGYYDERGDAPMLDDDQEIKHEAIQVPFYEPAGPEEKSEETLPPPQPPEVPAGHQQVPDQPAASSAPSDATQPHQSSHLHSRAPGTPISGLFKAHHERQQAQEPEAKRMRADEGLHQPRPHEIPVPDDEDFDMGLEPPPRPLHETDSVPDEQVSSVLAAALAEDKWHVSNDRVWLVRSHNKPRRRLFSPYEAMASPVNPHRLGQARQTKLKFVNTTFTYDPDSVKDQIVEDTWEKDKMQPDKGRAWVGKTRFRIACTTRKELKQLEKEIPWHLIPDEEREGYREALVKEWSVWLRYGAVVVLDLEASRYVEDHVDAARILNTRVL